MIRHDIIIEDTTLRDGEQAPGVAFSKEVKLKIFSKLIDTGIKWIEPGIPAMGGEEVDTLRAMLDRRDEVMLIGWNRGIREDIAFTIDLGFRAVHIGLPTSTVHLRESIGRDREWLLSKVADLIKYAKDRGVFVSISAEDVGRTDIPFLQEYAVAVASAGADRLRLSDTIGILGPEEYARRVDAVGQVSPIDVQCHCHNDYGLAVANRQLRQLSQHDAGCHDIAAPGAREPGGDDGGLRAPVRLQRRGGSAGDGFGAPRRELRRGRVPIGCQRGLERPAARVANETGVGEKR